MTVVEDLSSTSSPLRKQLEEVPTAKEAVEEVPTAEEAVELVQVEREVEKEIAAAVARRAAREAKTAELEEAIAASAAVRTERKAASRRRPRITIPLRKERVSPTAAVGQPTLCGSYPFAPKGTCHH